MSVGYNPRAVTDGLVLALDAGNTKSYPGSGTTWSDLSGNNHHMSLKNSPSFTTFNGAPCFDLDGSNDHGICDGTVTGSIAGTVTNLGVGGTNEKTVVCVACVDDGVGSDNGAMFDLGDSGSTGRQYSLRLKGSYTNWRAQFWSTPDYDFTYNTRAKWTMFSVVYGSDKIGRTYRDNGVLLGQDASAQDLATAGTRPFEMGRYAGGNYFGGKIGMYLVYNRGLMVEEITQNYNALRGRFGL